MDDKHRCNEDGLFLIIDVNGWALSTRRAFCGRLVTLSDRNINSCLHRLVLVTRILHLKVEFNEFLRVLWASRHRLNVHSICGGIVSLVRPRVRMENACCLFGHAA